MNVNQLPPLERIELLKAMTGAYTALGDGTQAAIANVNKVINEIAASFSDPEPGTPVLITDEDAEVLVQLLGIINGTRREMSKSQDDILRNVLRKIIGNYGR